ncbi:glycosyltransferase 87 family protein [Mesorhizobium sp.]|uniref:glycosyltransferase 87 family protein n=1 Tax=Mesorhizobium sp. TaxID=1871066 RepID=UPI0025DED84D|nr:glycosyltransferase 87 family protein [Mesorhizobium sp.]
MTITKPVFDRLGLLLWIGAFLIVLVLAWWAPDVRSVVSAYRHGSEAFVAGQPLYKVHVAMGYLYAPAFAALFVPFVKLGPSAGSVLWHTLCFGVLTLAAARQVRKIGGQDQMWLLSYALFLAMPMALGAIRNGQSTILLTGACWLLTLSALEGRRAEPFFWACVALIAKPTGLIMLLLVGALRPRLIPWLVLAVLVVLVIPYAFAPVGYINDQYRDFFQMLTSMAVDREGPFAPADFTVPFAMIGLPIPEFDATVVRIVAALLALSAVLWFDRKAEPDVAGIAIFLAATFYMCVFNPRVEPNTYAMIAVPAGVAIAYLWREEQGSTLAKVLATTLFLSGLTSIERHLHNFFHPWFRPVVVTVIACTLIRWFWVRARQPRSDAGRMAHG